MARLRNAIIKIEDDPLLVGELFRRVAGHDGHRAWPGPVACDGTRDPRAATADTLPHCERKALTLFGGDGWVTCRACHATIDRGWFDHWSAMLESERGSA